MQTPIFKYQNIVVPVIVPGAPTQVFFPDQPNLRDCRITGIESQDINLLPVTSDMSTPNVPITCFRNAFLTLIVGDVNNVTRMPLQNLQTIFDNLAAAGQQGRANMNPRDFQGLKIYWNKSYIEWPAAVTPAATCAFNIGVYYLDPQR
jgi:hypothetical protein